MVTSLTALASATVIKTSRPCSMLEGIHIIICKNVASALITVIFYVNGKATWQTPADSLSRLSTSTLFLSNCLKATLLFKNSDMSLYIMIKRMTIRSSFSIQKRPYTAVVKIFQYFSEILKSGIFQSQHMLVNN